MEQGYNTKIKICIALLVSFCSFIDIHAQSGIDYFKQGNYSLALPQLQNAAKAGNTDVLHFLGYMYEEGLGVEKSESIAINLYTRGIEQNETFCMLAMGRLLESKGQNEEAFGYFLRAAELGNGKAAYQVARCYYEGIGVVKDLSAVLKYGVQAADNRVFPIYEILGHMYYDGLGVAVDYKKALEWYTKGPEDYYSDGARLRKAEMYYKGYGTSKQSREYKNKKFPKVFVDDTGESGPSRITDALVILYMLLNDNYSSRAKKLYDEILQKYNELDYQSNIEIAPAFSEEANQYIRRFYEPAPPAIASAGRGNIKISCVVTAQGYIKDARFQKRLIQNYDDAAMSLVKGMPKLIPGTKGGNPVDMSVEFTIEFNRLKVSMSRR